MDLNEIGVCSPMSIISQDPVDQICPICSEEIRLYFINFNEKIRMCKNISCDYPFGYEPIEILTEENERQTTELKSCSQRSTCSNFSPYSQASSCDMEKLCTVFGSEDIPGLDLDQIQRSSKYVKSEAEKKNDEIKRKVEKIRSLTKSMVDVKPSSKNLIKNRNWIRNLSYLQGLSGINLLKPEEMKKVNVPTPVLQAGELKIDIDNTNKSSITIEIKEIPDTKVLET